jgi:predicted DCC family thiol-disulfide oxidoreductase YuxK
VLTVYYDGSCNLCSREIQVYMRADTQKAIKWCDLADPSIDLTNEPFERIDALKQLHVKDSSDRYHIGVDAFLAIWKQLPAWVWLYHVARIRPVKIILNKAYAVFAKHRFRRSIHCNMINQKKGEL